MIPWLHPQSLAFPSVDQALREPDGLLAAGGDLSPERLLSAYRQGIFPWFNPGEPILWWSPDPRCVLYPQQLHLSRSLRKKLKKNLFQVTFDTCFSRVIQACADVRQKQTGTWISPEIQSAYTTLHQQGIAHSVEVWQEQELVGGLYGLALGRVFFGESMFSYRSDASKTALAFLCHHLNAWGFHLIDCQVYNPHLESLGARLIPRAVFSQHLQQHALANHLAAWTPQFSTSDIIGVEHD